jgi:hypothetical protein
LAHWATTKGHTLDSRRAFCEAVRRATLAGDGYAAGKLGVTERALLYHPLLLDRERDPRRIRAFEQVLAFKAGRQSGVFPTAPKFLRDFSRWYSEQVEQLDCIGLMADSPRTLSQLFDSYRFAARLVYYKDQEPDRSIPADESSCYLPHFRGRRLLLVCPFAELLCSRANQQTFEAVWAKTGKCWFEPRSVNALEFPYGFEPETQRRYDSAVALYDELTAELATREFDVALIAAGGLGIPLAAFIRSHGKIAISLGGHLQVLFGVSGARWRGRESWRRRYITEAWIDMPPRYRPDMRYTSENYW